MSEIYKDGAASTTNRRTYTIFLYETKIGCKSTIIPGRCNCPVASTYGKGKPARKVRSTCILGNESEREFSRA
ncbi:uncharacterized protein LOC122818858 isoform X2 [Drosophila biarmipes]|uniref:uncharacterized protein LOC122818858 isoform X2 n=1 Tax=Drosophila biarmipes TaxID=125945 RepID=UPI0021CCDD20|nr:uncharacterized protein LOC122818858 isoform X2 [Drosophila biarmipes]